MLSKENCMGEKKSETLPKYFLGILSGLNMIFLWPVKLSFRNDVRQTRWISDLTSDKTFILKKIRTSRACMALKTI